MLSSVFAPGTFAFVFATSPLVNLELPDWADLGRELAPHERSARDVIEHAERIMCPVYLEHGTADEVVPCEGHTVALARRLESLGKDVSWRLWEGGGHGLAPVTDRMSTFKAEAPGRMMRLERSGEDDFSAGRVVEIPCADRTLRIDWSKPGGSCELVKWV